MNPEKSLARKFGKGLRRIQRADDGTKKRWLVASSTVSMVAIIALWVVYLNMTLPAIAGSETKEAREPASEEGIGSVMGRGWQKLKEDFSETYENFKKELDENLKETGTKMEQKNSFSIENVAPDFSPQIQEPLPTSTLP